jgi:predicted transcriptional regulator
VVFICKDITLINANYGQLIPGQSYLINDEEITSTLNLLNILLDKNQKGAIITRKPYENIIQQINAKQVSIAILSSTPIPKAKTITDLHSLKTYIKNITNKDKNSVICITRLDYLITLFGFQAVLNSLYEINDIIRKNQAILLLQINNQLLQEKEFELLREEYYSLPSKEIREIYLNDSSVELLSYIYEQNQSNLKVYQKNICNQLSISKVTAQKRIDELIDKELVFSKKQGRIKNLHVTEKGKEFLKKQG